MNPHSHKCLVVLAVGLVTLLTASSFCLNGYPSRAAERSGIRRSESQPASARNASVVDSSQAAVSRADKSYGKLPLSFEANLGQTDPGARFISRGSSSTLFLTTNGAVLAFRDHRRREKALSRVPVAAIRMNMVGANANPEITGRQRLQGNVSYFTGKDPNKWRSAVPTYARVKYRELYPAIDLVYYGNEQQLEYDFEVSPGGDPSAIKLRFEGVEKISIDENGDLVVHKAGNEIRMHKPVVYQEADGEKQSVSGRYVLRGRRQIGFEIGRYDKNRALVIDPVLTYSTFLGGNDYDYGRSIAIDSTGNAYVTGQTTSFNFPVTINSYNTTYANGADVFVTKLNADGTAVIYSTYLGGNSEDIGYCIAIDGAGNAYVSGSTGSTNYPTTAGAFQTTLHGNYYYNGDAFVTKLNVDGTALVYSTFLGGSNSERANGIAIDSSGNAYIAGYTYSGDFPTTSGAFKTNIAATDSQDAFITKLNATGTGLVYSTFLGGLGVDQATAIKTDSSGYAYVTGTTTSANFDTTAGAYQTTYGGSGSNYNGYGDAFATKLNLTGSGLVYSTYLGGANDDAGLGLDLASSGEVYLTGSTASADFPTTPGVVRVVNGGMAKSTTAGNSWFATNSGLTTPTELSLAIDPSNPNVVFVGSYGGGVFKSTDGGGSWTPKNSGLTDLIVNALTVDPATSIVYLGTNSRGIFRSTDGGGTWKAINNGQNGTAVNSIKLDPVASSTIYAGTNNGVFKTTNGGGSWTAANNGLNQGLSVSVIAIDPATPSTVFAGLTYYGGGVFKSTDSGSHWIATSLNTAGVRALTIDPSTTSTLYAGTDSGVLKSTDGGANWVGVNAGLTTAGVVSSLAISPADSSTIYSGTGNGVFKSTNGGAIWSRGNDGLAGAVINALAIDPATALTLYCGSAAGSTDAFVTKLNVTGTALGYSTYLGGSGADGAASIAIDSSNNAYVTGATSSSNFPTTRGVFQNFGGYSTDAFVAKLNPAGTTLVYSSYLGGTDYDQGYGVVVDSAGSAYVTGYTQSQNFPISSGAFQSVKNSYSPDAFIARVAAVPSLSANLAITMTPSDGPFTSGSYLSYNIVLTNNGPEQASSVVVSDDLPSSLVFNGCNSSYNYCSHIGNSVRFLINSLDVGASVNMQISVNVGCSIPSSVMIDNTITVDSSASDPNLANNSALVSINATNPPTVLQPDSQFVSSSGGNNTVNVNKSGNCGWSSMSNASWITITYSANCCNGPVFYTVAANPGAARTGTLTLDNLTFTVNQASGCTTLIDHASKDVTSAGGTDSVAVTASDVSCSWTALKTDSWITINSGSSGAGNGTVDYSVTSNTGPARSGIITIAGQTFTVNQGAAALQGFHDAAGCDTISGWAWDTNNPGGAVSVDIYDGTLLIGTTPANMYREDLLNALASPNHGFSLNTPAALKNGAVHTINVKFAGTNTLLSNTARTMHCTGAPNLIGRHDGQGCGAIEGWAWDSNDSTGTVNVDVYDGATLIGSVAATLYRQDLADAFGSPYHGFIFHPPASLKDGQSHTISVKYGGTTTNLPSSPRSFVCNSSTTNYQGNFDAADCNFISGYAWDANDDNTINVAIYVDGVFRVVVPAQQVYPGIGNGFHGFKFAVPANLKNGQPHSIQVKYSGTTTNLSNSPKTITCSP